MSDEFTVLALVATRLDATGIGYMLSGPVAMGYYAQPRMTRDLFDAATRERIVARIGSDTGDRADG